MKVTVLDTQTGKTAESSGIRTFEWEENNYSCDCNRETLFGLSTNEGICLGGKRFIVIKAEVESEDDYECSLADLNADYPVELLEANGIPPNTRIGRACKDGKVIEADDEVI